MKRILFSTVLFACVLTLFAQPPSTYYQSIDGKKKEALKSALHDVIAPHTKIKYNDLWSAYEKVDYVVGKKNSAGHYQVFDYYSDEIFYFAGNGNAVSGMNKEHVAPQSWWGGGTGINVGCDLFQVIPSQATANSAKSNYCLGVVSGAVSYPKSNQSNTRMRTGHNANGKMVFEPCDEYKGDFARIYFYVAVCYPDVAWENSISGTEVAFTKQDYPTLKASFQE